LDGVIVSESWTVPPIVVVAEDLLIETLVTGMIADVTVTLHAAVLEPSTVVTVIIAFPVETPRTEPFESTVATLVLLLDHVTFWFTAVDGEIVSMS
jgi:hypothetical protein